MKDLINQRFKDSVDYLIENNLEKNKSKLADKLNITAPKLSEIMGGRMYAPVEAIVEVCNKYHISFDWMFNGKEPMFVHSFGYMSEPVDQYNIVSTQGNARRLDENEEPVRVTNKNGIDFLFYPNNDIRVEVLEIPFPAYASYVEAYNDEDKLHQEFAKSTFTVDKLGRGFYLGFKVTGDSMNGGGIDDTPDGAQVLARELGRHHWQDGFRKSQYGFILMTQSNIYHKDITGFDLDSGMLTLSSRNKANKPFTVSINEVSRIFKVIKRAF